MSANIFSKTSGQNFVVRDPIFVSFHFSLYCYLIMQCRSKVGFFGGANHECRRLELLGGSWGMLPQKVLKYSFKQFLTVEAINK